MRESIEGIIDATRFVTVLASNNAPDPVRDANFKGCPILQLCYVVGHTRRQSSRSQK